jgi:hypothetical protein
MLLNGEFPNNLDDSIHFHTTRMKVVPELQPYVQELKQFLFEILNAKRLPRGNIFPVKCYIWRIGGEYYFDLGRYSYDDRSKELWSNK